MCASSLVAAVAEGSGPEGVVGGEGVVVQVGGAHKQYNYTLGIFKEETICVSNTEVVHNAIHC